MQASSSQKKKVRLFTCDRKGQHEDQLLNMVCITCNYQLCCLVCLKQDHQNHKVEPLKFIVENVVKKHSQSKLEIKNYSDAKQQAKINEVIQLRSKSLLNEIICQLENQIHFVKQTINSSNFKVQNLTNTKTQNFSNLVDSIYQIESAERFQNVIQFLSTIQPQEIIQNSKREKLIQREISMLHKIENKIFNHLQETTKLFKRQISQRLLQSHLLHKQSKTQSTSLNQAQFKFYVRQSNIPSTSPLAQKDYSAVIVKKNLYFISVSKKPIPVLPFMKFNFEFQLKTIGVGLCTRSQFANNSYQVQKVASTKPLYYYEQRIFNEKPIIGLILDRSSKTLTFTKNGSIVNRNKFQTDVNLYLFVACQNNSQVEYLGAIDGW